MTPERLAEIREMLPVVEPIEGVELRGCFPVEDAADDLLAEVDRLAAENAALYAREAACMADLEAVGAALGWQAGDHAYPDLASGVGALRTQNATLAAALVDAARERDEARAEVARLERTRALDEDCR